MKDTFKQLEDPLEFHNPEGKSDILSQALDFMKEKNHVFYPAMITYPQIFGGHL
jgi:hypothetical protein